MCGCLEGYLLLEARPTSSNPLREKRKDPSFCLSVFEQGFSRLGLELETVLLLQPPKCEPPCLVGVCVCLAILLKDYPLTSIL